jgi:plasmid stabilization system protein ParE
MYKVKWSAQAWDSYNYTLVNLVERWSVNMAQKLDDDVLALLERLSNNRHLCPPSEKLKGMRRCKISKYTSLLYVVKGNDVELVTFFDTRMNHPF